MLFLLFYGIFVEEMVGEVVITPRQKLEDLIRLAELCVDLLRQNEEFYAEVSLKNDNWTNDVSDFLLKKKEILILLLSAGVYLALYLFSPLVLSVFLFLQKNFSFTKQTFKKLKNRKPWEKY